MVVDGDGKILFGVILADDILIEEFLDFARLGDVGHGDTEAFDPFSLLPDDIVAQVDTLGADKYAAGAFHKRIDLLLRTTAKTADIMPLAAT
jgi:hypothetical protein